MIPKNRRPITPGNVLRADFGDLLLSLNILSDIDRRTVNEVVYDNKAITPDMARHLARVAKTSVSYWIHLQQAVDRYDNR